MKEKFFDQMQRLTVLVIFKYYNDSRAISELFSILMIHLFSQCHESLRLYYR